MSLTRRELRMRRMPSWCSLCSSLVAVASVVLFLLLASFSTFTSASMGVDIRTAADDTGGRGDGKVVGSRLNLPTAGSTRIQREHPARSDRFSADVHAASMHERRRRDLHGAVIFLPINGGEDVVFIYKFEEGREQVRPRSAEVTVITSLVFSVFVASTLMAIVWLSRHKDDDSDADEHPLKYMDPFHVHDRSRMMRSLSGNVMQTLKESGQLHGVTINPVYDSMAHEQVTHPSNGLVAYHAGVGADDILTGDGLAPLPMGSMLMATPPMASLPEDVPNDHDNAMSMSMATGRRDEDDVEWQSPGIEYIGGEVGGGGADARDVGEIQQDMIAPLSSPPIVAAGDGDDRVSGEGTTTRDPVVATASPPLRPFDVLLECNIHEKELLTLTKMMNAQERLVHAYFQDSQLRRLSMSLSDVGTKIAQHINDSKLATTRAYDVLVRHIKAARADGDALQVALLAERRRRENEGDTPVSSSMPFTNQEKINSALRQIAILLDANRTRFVHFVRRGSRSPSTAAGGSVGGGGNWRKSFMRKSERAT